MRHKCLASFLVFLLFFTVSSVIVFWEIRSVLKPEFITKTLRDSGIYSKLEETANNIVNSSEQKGVESAVLIKYFARVLNPEYTRTQVEKNSQNFFNYLSGKSNNLSVVFDLKPLKNAIDSNLKNSPDLSNIIKDEVNSLPPCGEDFQPKQNEIPSCLPVGITKDQFAIELQKQIDINKISTNIPDTYDVAKNLKNFDTINSLRIMYKAIFYSFWISLILSIIFLGLLALLGKSWWPSILRWMGLGLLLPSGNILILNLVSAKIQDATIKGLDPKIYSFLLPIMEAINKNTLVSGLTIAGIIFIIGAILIVLSYALPHPPEPKTPQSGVNPKSEAPNPKQITNNK